MDEVTRQRELDDVDSGQSPHEVLTRTAGSERRRLDQTLADLNVVASDEEILDRYGVDMASMRGEVDWSQVWSLP